MIALRKPVTNLLFKEVLKKPEQHITELGRKLDKPQPTISRALRDLEIAQLVKTKLMEKNGKIVKLVFPSLKGLFMNVAEIAEKHLTQLDYEAIDNHLLNPKISKIVFENYIKKEDVDLMSAILGNLVLLAPKLKKLMKDPHVKQTSKPFMKVMSKLGMSKKH